MASPTLKPANAQQTATRRRELFLAYETKVFNELRRGRTPVPLAGPLGNRSEILLGLRLTGEDNDTARRRIIKQFCDKHPGIAAAKGLVDASA